MTFTSEPAVTPTPSPRDRLAQRLRGFGPLGLLAIVVILAGMTPAISAPLVLLWAWLSRTPWRDLGFARPRSWLATFLVGVVFGVAFKFFMKAAVMPLLGADPVNHAFQHLTGNAAAVPGFVALILYSAAFCEETLFRGYLFERLGRLFGSSAPAKVAIVALAAVLFGLAHLGGQGVPGAEQATIVGLAFGAIYAITRRVWPLMFAHAAFDLTALWMIYNGLETRIAHLIFH
jgi:membrane protease YdiL (CAAX protease family)